MKIFKNNLKKNNYKPIPFNKNKTDVGRTKYLPSFAKEWKNTVYCYNKNTLKNIPVNDLNINKIITSYFNLYFKNNKFSESKFILLKRRRNLLRRIFVSNAEIKHTNNKAIITLYTVNREKDILKKKYLTMKKVNQKLIWQRYIELQKESIDNSYELLNKYKAKLCSSLPETSNEDVSASSKESFLKYKLLFISKFMKLQSLYSRKILSVIINKYIKRHLRFLRKYDLLYSLNQYKFNKLVFLPILSKILNKIIGKKIEYNIINLKSITYNTDLFTNALALKLKKRKVNHINSMLSVLNRANLALSKSINRALEEEQKQNNRKMAIIQNKYEDLRIISALSDNIPAGSFSTNNFDRLLDGIYPTKIVESQQTANSRSSDIHKLIYNSIKYKNMVGIRLEIKGRLTKRYRADRSIYALKWKGGLKNIDSSFKGLSSVLFRGNSKTNTTYSMVKSKRRIGAFAVKGWISGW